MYVRRYVITYVRPYVTMYIYEDVRVPVRVVADGADGKAELQFCMKPSTTFAKMMNAWSQHYNIPLEEAVFMRGNILH